MPRRLISRHLLPGLVAALFALPLVFMITGSLRPAGAPPPAGLEFLPASPTLASYGDLSRLLPLGTYLRNSVTVVAIAVPLTVLVASWAGFAIRSLPPPRRRRATLWTLVAAAIPVTAVWATRFELFRLAGVIDTFVPLVAPALLGTTPFLVLVYVWSFGRIPDAQFDALRLDGSRPIAAWWHVGLPQVRPSTFAVVVVSFTFHWSNFIDPLLYLRSHSRYTLSLGLRTLQSLAPTSFQLLLAGSVLLTLPVVAVLLVAQRRLLDDPRRIVGMEVDP